MTSLFCEPALIKGSVPFLDISIIIPFTKRYWPIRIFCDKINIVLLGKLTTRGGVIYGKALCSLW